MTTFNFENLFILDIANNHQGDVQHGKNIIRQLGAVVTEAGVRAAVKFQFRQLETFIHPEHQQDSTAKHIDRFKSTRLDLENYAVLVAEVRKHNMLTMCTPFDEESVSIIQEMDFDVIKVASCSMNDRPLIDKVVSANMPVVISTGGARISDLDRVVQVFTSSEARLALEHCVSIYPTPPDQLQLNQIGNLRTRYPGIPIGWSTHEDPDDYVTIQLAVAKGAQLFERHVGLETSEYSLNHYSSNPDQIRNWFKAHADGLSRCGAPHRSPAPQIEIDSLNSLKRGVYAASKITTGQQIKREHVFFAMPSTSGGLVADDWQEGYVADREYHQNSAILGGLAAYSEIDEQRINSILLQVQGLLRAARIKLADSSGIELSHHYGLARFREFGAVIIDVINREYCKKLIVQLPRQKHPYHFHKKKEETFQVLFGDLEVEKNGEPMLLSAGDLYLVEPDNWHKFSTRDGVVFEEISTTHFNDDSFYEDPKINQLKREQRKTIVDGWHF
jgi:sialic acid synthase SpsE/quercetin dioxygenase-like cupin family protein